MKKLYVVSGIVGIVLFVAVVRFVWPMLAVASIEGGLVPVIIMIVACFLVGGVLAFLVLYSSRKGYDDLGTLETAADVEGEGATPAHQAE